MKEKFIMSLVWHNCKTYPPKEEYNACLYVSNGNYVTKAKYHKEYGWLDKESGLIIQDRYLHEYWWADLKQTIKSSRQFFRHKYEQLPGQLDIFDIIGNKTE